MHNKSACAILSITVAYILFSGANRPLPQAAAAESEDASDQADQNAKEEPPPATRGPVVLLGVFANEKTDKSLRDAVIDRLTRFGEAVSSAPESSELAECKQSACYDELSRRLNAQRLLRVDVYESTPQRYYLEGVLFVQQTGNTRTAKSSCEDCSSESLRIALGDMTVRMVAGSEPAQRVGSDKKIDALAPAPAPHVVHRSRWTPERISLVTLLSTLTAATLVGTILLPGLAPSKDAGYCSVDREIPVTPENLHCVRVSSWTIGGIVLTALSTSSLALTLRQFLRNETVTDQGSLRR